MSLKNNLEINLQKILKKEFPSCEIVKLKDITIKIAGISKVRIGDVRTYTDYDEISLNYIDEYGVVYIPQNYKEAAPANANAMKNQILQEGDLVMTQRGNVGKVGLICSGYKKPIVGNNSMIRIQFPHNKRKDTPLFVQTYLQLPYVREYLDNQITCGSVERKILSSASLAELPIPLFKETGGLFQEFLYTRMELSLEATRFKRDLDELIELYDKRKDETVSLAINKSDELFEIHEENEKTLLKLSKLRESLSEFLNEGE